MAVDWDAGLIILVFISGATVGFATCLYQLRQRRQASISTQTKHRLQLLFDSHLFDSYSNEAIDHFIQALDVTAQTLPVHISVGRHFRQQGEVDKAILVHQNLLAHPELSDEASGSVTFELARDYHKAGLLDRAEALLLELSKSISHALPSQMLLMEIYEQERDWNKAIATALNTGRRDDVGLRLRLAHYHCELAEEAGARFSRGEIVELCRKALTFSADCVRARLALAHIHLHEGAVEQAFAAARDVVEHSDYAVLTVPVFERCLEAPELRDEVLAYLESLGQARQNLPILLLLLQQESQSERAPAIEQSLLQVLTQDPSAQALQYCVQHTQTGRQALSEPLRQPMLAYLDRQCREQKSYQCRRCGFSGATMHWQCPGCHDWQSIHPVEG